MSGMLKVIGLKPAAARVNGIRIPSSLAGVAVPIVYGAARLQGNLIDYIDWSSSASGGKSGKMQSKMGGTANTYKAAIINALCEGPIDGLAFVWSDKDNPADFNGIYAPNYGWSAFLGSGPAQTPWSYMTTHHAALARPYPYTAYVVNPNLNLPGDSTPHMTFEILGLKRFGAATPTVTGAAVTGGGAQTFNTNLSAADGTYNNGIIEFTSGVLAGYIGQVTTYLHSSGQVSVAVAFPSAPSGGDNFNIYPNSDALPSAIVLDALTDANHGLVLPSSMIGDWTSFADYCQAVGLFVSPVFDQAQPANSALEKLFSIANCAPFWSDGTIKVVPYGDTAVTGNGITWTPNSTPAYNLTDDDFIRSGSEAPIQIVRKPPAEAYNRVTVDYEDRGFQYNTQTQEAKDDAAIAQAGRVLSMPQISYPEIKIGSVARIVAQLALQRSLWVRNTYSFTLPANFCLLEPMDLVTLTDAEQGMNQYTVRLTSVNWTSENLIECEAEDWPFGTATAALYGAGYSGGYIPDANVDPGSTAAPFVVDCPVQIATSPCDVLINASGGEFWGGCDVYLSYDGNNYTKVGQIINRSAYGVTTATFAANAGGAYPNVDTTNTCAVDLTTSGGAMTSQPAAAFSALVPLCYVGGEWIAYETAALVSGYSYNVSHLYRGLFGSQNASHSTGAAFGVIDFSAQGGTFRLQVPQAIAGTVIYLKLPAFNVYGKSEESLGAVTAYSHTIGQAGVTVYAVPPQGTVNVAVDGTWTAQVDGPSTAQSYSASWSTSGFPSDATAAASPYTYVGRTASLTGFSALTLGAYIYITVIPWTSSTPKQGTQLPSIHLLGNWGGSASKTVYYSAGSMVLSGNTPSGWAWNNANGKITLTTVVASPPTTTIDFVAYVPMPTGCTLTNVAVNVYNFWSVAVGYQSASGGYTSLGTGNSSIGLSWQIISINMSQTTGVRLAIDLGNDNLSGSTGCAAAGFYLTYTMPDTSKTY